MWNLRLIYYNPKNNPAVSFAGYGRVEGYGLLQALNKVAYGIHFFVTHAFGNIAHY